MAIGDASEQKIGKKKQIFGFVIAISSATSERLCIVQRIHCCPFQVFSFYTGVHCWLRLQICNSTVLYTVLCTSPHPTTASGPTKGSGWISKYMVGNPPSWVGFPATGQKSNPWLVIHPPHGWNSTHHGQVIQLPDSCRFYLNFVLFD